MDTSLAKGLKNQLFKELSDEINSVAGSWAKHCKKSKINFFSRNKWEIFYADTVRMLGHFSLASHRGGSKRNPFLCVATFENQEIDYESWKEKCISSHLIYITMREAHVESVPMGFSIGEHAIQRIFERTYLDSTPLEDGFKKIYFANELNHAPLWSTFWISRGFSRFAKDPLDSIEIVMPGQNGLFLGKISRDSIHRCQLRTFVSKQQLSSSQLILFEKMQKISDEYKNSIIPFCLIDFISKQKTSESEFNLFMNHAQKLI